MQNSGISLTGLVIVAIALGIACIGLIALMIFLGLQKPKQSAAPAVPTGSASQSSSIVAQIRSAISGATGVSCTASAHFVNNDADSKLAVKFIGSAAEPKYYEVFLQNILSNLWPAFGDGLPLARFMTSQDLLPLLELTAHASQDEIHSADLFDDMYIAAGVAVKSEDNRLVGAESLPGRGIADTAIYLNAYGERTNEQCVNRSLKSIADNLWSAVEKMQPTRNKRDHLVVHRSENGICIKPAALPKGMHSNAYTKLLIYKINDAMYPGCAPNPELHLVLPVNARAGDPLELPQALPPSYAKQMVALYKLCGLAETIDNQLVLSSKINKMPYAFTADLEAALQSRPKKSVTTLSADKVNVSGINLGPAPQ